MTENWKLSGTYFESCNCDVGCPCIFLSAPTEGECKALVGWHIDDGNYGDTSLNGLNVALAVYSPGHMAETQWQAAAYVDDRASEAQQNALLAVFGGQAGGHPARLASHVGEMLGAASAAIEFTAEGGKYGLKVGEIAAVEIEQTAGQGDGPIEITGHPLCISPGFPLTVAKSKSLTYNDHGLSWSLSDKNGYFAPFTYQND